MTRSRQRDLQAVPERPVLHLSGTRLARSFAALVERSEPGGGVEGYVTGLRFKCSLFAEALRPGNVEHMSMDTFTGLCAFMAPVRRRIGAFLAANEYARVRRLVAGLLHEAQDTADADARIGSFCAAFPQDRKHRWVRDLAGELLHNAYPERYPLMTRWVWDAQANTGVVREIWHAPDVDHITIDVPDGYETFLTLREELAGFLSTNGVYRDVLHYVDLLCAQVYAEYIAAQGGSYLRTDFSSPQDEMAFTRRMLGLDGIDPDSGRTRVKRADGRPFVIDEAAFRS